MTDKEQRLPRAFGVSRDEQSPGGKSVLIAFERALTDDELRQLHNMLAATAPSAQGQEKASIIREALEYSLKVQNFAQHVHTARQDRELAAMEPILRKLTEEALKQLS